MLSLFETDLVVTEVHYNEVGRGHCIRLISEPEPVVSDIYSIQGRITKETALNYADAPDLIRRQLN